MLSDTEEEDQNDQTLPELEERTSFTIEALYEPQYDLSYVVTANFGNEQQDYFFLPVLEIFHPPQV
jgi:hypothetical protein